ncbi:MAG: hypothetical protein AB7I08_08535 [Thermoleophilia bacterium]
MTVLDGRRRFALDQNFPDPIIDSLGDWITEAELVPLRRIDARLPTFEDDWRILLALHHHADPWDGLITTDSGMLNLPREMAVLEQTKLTLVVALAAGHDPLKATGLLLAYLPGICGRTSPEKAQLWTLNAAPTPASKPWEKLQRIAEHRNRDVVELYREERLSDEELAENPLR